MRIIYPFIVILLSLIVSQLSSAHDIEVELPPVSFTPPSKLVTKSGSNRQPIFISNTGFIFVSSNRQYHNDPQIYFKDLKTGREKRITHQRGQIINGVWVDKEGKLIYASTTDEDKETPFIMKDYVERFPSSADNNFFFHINLNPSEIYSSLLDGSEVERLSHHMGFDAFPAYSTKYKRLFFSRWENGHINLFAKNIGSPNAWRVVKTLGHDLGLQLSPSQNQFVWFRFSPDFKTSQLMKSSIDLKDPQFLTLDGGVSWSPVWHPNGETVLYSAKLDNSHDYDLYEVSVDQACKRKITSYEGDEFFPSISPDGKTVLFTSTQAGTEQIHQLPYPEPFACD